VTNDGAAFVQKLTGAWPVFPGHPLVIAAAIIELYSSFEEAARLSASNTPAAVCNNAVPGTGDHAYAAIDALARGNRGASVDEMVAVANDYWVRGQAGGHVRYVEAGIAQAKLIEPWFREHAAKWVLSTSVQQPEQVA
jgi:hypothetical protein